MIGTYAFIILVRVVKNCWRSLTHVETICTRAGLDFVSCRKPTVVATTTTTTKSYDQRLCYRVETFISFNYSLSSFPRAYKANLTSSPDDMMMRFKLSGRGSMALKFVEIDCIIIKRK